MNGDALLTIVMLLLFGLACIPGAALGVAAEGVLERAAGALKSISCAGEAPRDTYVEAIKAGMAWPKIIIHKQIPQADPHEDGQLFAAFTSLR